MNELDDELRMIAGFKADHHNPQGLPYPSYEALVLAKGTAWDEAVVRRNGEPKFCYMNAFNAAVEHGWQYVEGFARSLFPTMHAWCVDDGQAVELTWETSGEGYRGIIMDLDTVRATMLKTEMWGVMPNDYLNNVALLRANA